MIYNQQRHIQLLKRSQDFKDQGKSFYKESPEESLELSSYNAAVEENIFWQQRYKVAELMQDFLNRKIDGQKFCGRVFGLRRNLMIASDKFLIQLGAYRQLIKENLDHDIRGAILLRLDKEEKGVYEEHHYKIKDLNWGWKMFKLLLKIQENKR